MTESLVEEREALLDKLEVEILTQLRKCMSFSHTKSAIDWSNIYSNVVNARMKRTETEREKITWTEDQDQNKHTTKSGT